MAFMPFTCTQNSLFHIDYGTPLLANRGTDYRTSSGKNHDFLPSVPQQFDCRVTARMKPKLKQRDIALRNEYKSTYNLDFPEKHNAKNAVADGRGLSSSDIGYFRTVEEKIFRNPPPPGRPICSEMKNTYSIHNCRPHGDIKLSFSCEIPESYRVVQPDINSAVPGFYKYLDNYLSENRSKYVPYTKQQLTRAQEDLITIYNSNDKHKGLMEEIPGKLNGNTAMYDKEIFKKELPHRIASNARNRVVNFGMTSEYQWEYLNPTCLEFYPYQQENGVYFPESLPRAGPWQNLPSSAMYCSENCHLGTGWPIRSVVDINFSRTNK